MKVGDLVYDVAAQEVAIIIERYPKWIDNHGETHVWDYKILSFGQTFFVDEEDLEKVF